MFLFQQLGFFLAFMYKLLTKKISKCWYKKACVEKLLCTMNIYADKIYAKSLQAILFIFFKE